MRYKVYVERNITEYMPLTLDVTPQQVAKVCDCDVAEWEKYLMDSVECRQDLNKFIENYTGHKIRPYWFENNTHSMMLAESAYTVRKIYNKMTGEDVTK